MLFAKKFSLDQNAYMQGHTSTMACETLEFIGFAKKFVKFIVRPAGHDLESDVSIFYKKLQKVPMALNWLTYTEF